VSHLRKLTPRLYSISSSIKAFPEQVHLTVASVRYDAFGRSRKGVCSTFLADRANGPMPVFVQTSHGFRLPKSGDTPIIMVGPGTGVAPFRAFLHERRAVGAKGRNWLFFGEQRAATDFFYREELEQMLADGHLTTLTTAFSRDQAEKIYVQHRMAEQGAELFRWLEEGAHFYVCGDASRMAKDVDAALHAAIEKHGGVSAEAAAEYVKKLKADKRYQRDVY
jgi:sulfite reductase (NADPH) flavoprotein alpha-component